MKRKTLKKIASLLALTIAATTVFAGCGEKKDTANDASKAEESKSTESEDAEQSETADVTEKTGSIKVMVYDRGTIPASEGDMDNNRWADWIKENAPVKEIEFVGIPKSEGYETMALQYAGGDGPDLFPNTETRLTDFYQQGMVLEITDEMLDKMPNYKAMLETYPALLKCNSRDGKLLGFGRYDTFGHNHAMVVRADWMENLGIEEPKTIDEFYDMLYKFTYEDPDGNGVNDTWAINMTTDAQRVTAHMFGFGNPEKYTFDEDGKLVYAWENIEAWLAFAKKVVDNKLVNPDFLTMKADDDQADFLNGRIGIWCTGRFTNSARFSTMNSVKSQMPETAKLTSFALPDAGFGVFTANATSGIGNEGFISSDAKDVDAVLTYANWLYDPGVTEYLKYGPEGEYYERNEYGTWYAVNAEKNATEYDYSQDYNLLRCATSKSDVAAGYIASANDTYNVELSAADEVTQELGALTYKLFSIANEPNVPDPRVYLTQGKPALPDELTLIQSTTDTLVNDILKAGLADSNRSAADIVAEAKSTWIAAGGEQVDAWYAEYYATDELALLPSDFLALKVVPELTPLAADNLAKFE